MDVVSLVAQARAAGLAINLDDGRLIVTGPRSAAPLIPHLREHKPAILALLLREAADVRWRVEVFRRQIPARGPIPFLIAREGVRMNDAPRACGHCGDPLPDDRRFSCGLCQRAKEIVLLEVREEVPLSHSQAASAA